MVMQDEHPSDNDIPYVSSKLNDLISFSLIKVWLDVLVVAVELMVGRYEGGVATVALSRWFSASEGWSYCEEVVFFNSEIKKKVKKLHQLFVLARLSSQM
jgi:hypothetical protein